MTGRVVAAASAVSAGLALHTAVNAQLLRRPPAAPPPVDEPVSVLLPVRDEAARVASCVRAVLASRGVDLELLVLDDGSTDGTADVVRAAAAGDPRVRVLPGRPLPEGWLGKPHACAQLAAAAAGAVLVFVDADVVVAPDGIAAAVGLLRGGGLALISPYPRQLADGLAPRLAQPLLQWSWLAFVPLRVAEHGRYPSMAVANGQFLVADAAAYRATGGHAAVRGTVVEDVALARLVTRAGGRVALADGTRLAACRMYEGWADLRDGYAKSLWAAFGSPAGAVAAAALLVWSGGAPAAAAAASLLRRRPRAALVPLGGYAAGVASRVVAARRTGGRPADALAHPLSVALFAGLVARSLRARATGRLAWKGRAIRG